MGEVLAVAFTTDQVNTRFQLPDGFQYDPAVLALPNLRGYGLVPDLWVAMSLDPVLRQMVENFSVNDIQNIDDLIGEITHPLSTNGRIPPPAYQMSSFEKIIARWVGVDLDGTDEGAEAVDVVEKFINRSIVQGPANERFYGIFQELTAGLATRYLASVALLDQYHVAIDIAQELIANSQIGEDTLSDSQADQLFARLESAQDEPRQTSDFIASFDSLSFNFGHDAIGGDRASFVDGLLQSLPFDEANPWQDYADWTSNNRLLLEAVDRDGAILAERHRNYTQNHALAILGGPHEEHIGSSGNDTIVSNLVNEQLADLIRGNAGNDLLQGGDGSDTYVFDEGFGQDVIDDSSGSLDEIAFQGGLNSTLVQFAFADSGQRDLLISFVGRSDQITVKNFFTVTGVTTIEKLTFPDGASISASDIRDAVMASLANDQDQIVTAFATGSSVYGGGGNDTLYGQAGADFLKGGFGNDILDGGGRDDTYIYERGDGDDLIIERTNQGNNDQLILQNIEPASVSLERDGSHVILVIGNSSLNSEDGGRIKLANSLEDYFSQGIEKIRFDDGTIWDRETLRVRLLAEASTVGDDTISGFSVSDTITGGLGNDALAGGSGNDTYIYARGDGDDVITEGTNQGNADKLVLQGIDPASVSLERSGNDVTLVIAESAAGAGDGGRIRLPRSLSDYFDEGVDQIQFEDGTVWTPATMRVRLLAEASTVGDDTISGFSVSDTITGGLGNDALAGGSGNDTYIYARGDGDDVITESTNAGSADKLVLQGIDPASVSLERSGNDVTLVIAESAAGAGDGGRIRLPRSLSDYFDEGVDQIQFEDGTVWTPATMRVRLLAEASTVGDDTISGFSVSDTITGGLGNDALAGGSGNDTYIYARGDGDDVITEGTNQGNADKLVLQGIDPASVSLERSGNDVTLVIAESAAGAGDGGRIRLPRSLSDYFDEGVDQIQFEDGTVWTPATMRVRLLAEASTVGDDTISGFSVSDTITGGLGNDALAGGSGNDTYIYARGDGDDVITEGTNQGNADKLVLQGIDPASVSLERSGNDVTLVIAESATGAGDGGRIRLPRSLSDYFDEGVDQIQFEDGTVWTPATMRVRLLAEASTVGDDTISGFSVSDTITGGLGNDALAGGSGNDTYIYARGDGDDVITEGTNQGNADKLVLQGIDPADINVVRNNKDVTLTISATQGNADQGTIRLEGSVLNSSGNGVENILFDNGTIWTQATLMAIASVDLTIYGTRNNDVLYGTSGNDTFDAGLGDDTLRSGAGSDTYIYRSGDGNDLIDDESSSRTQTDTLKLLDINSSDVTFSRVGKNSVINITSTGHNIVLDEQFYNADYWGIEIVLFADGETWDRNRIQKESWIRGSSGNDVLYGSTADDTFDAGRGDDTLRSGAGSDTYIYRSGDGNDLIDDESSSRIQTDTLKLLDINSSDVTFSRVGKNSVINITSTGHNIVLDEQFYNADYWGIEIVLFADGETWDRNRIQKESWIRGSSGNDVLYGSTADDTFDAGRGDDTLRSGAGSDTYIYRSGDGNDLIDDESSSRIQTDTLKLLDINSSDVTFSRVGKNSVINITSTGHNIVLDEQFYNADYWGIEKVVFADGETWDRERIRTESEALSSTLNSASYSTTSLPLNTTLAEEHQSPDTQISRFSVDNNKFALVDSYGREPMFSAAKKRSYLSIHNNLKDDSDRLSPNNLAVDEENKVEARNNDVSVFDQQKNQAYSFSKVNKRSVEYADFLSDELRVSLMRQDMSSFAASTGATIEKEYAGMTNRSYDYFAA